MNHATGDIHPYATITDKAAAYVEHGVTADLQILPASVRGFSAVDKIEKRPARCDVGIEQCAFVGVPFAGECLTGGRRTVGSDEKLEKQKYVGEVKLLNAHQSEVEALRVKSKEALHKLDEIMHSGDSGLENLKTELEKARDMLAYSLHDAELRN